MKVYEAREVQDALVEPSEVGEDRVLIGCLLCSRHDARSFPRVSSLNPPEALGRRSDCPHFKMREPRL